MDSPDLAACLFLIATFFLATFILGVIVFSRLYISLIDIDNHMRFLMKDRVEAFPFKSVIGCCIAIVFSCPVFVHSLKHDILLAFLSALICISVSSVLLTKITGTWLRKYVETWAIVLAEIRSDGADQSKENNFWRFEYEQWLMLLYVIDETLPGTEGIFVDESICGSSNRLTKNNKWKLQTMLYEIDEAANGRIKISRRALDPL